MIRLALVISLAGAVPAVADVALTFPGNAIETFTETESFTSYQMPIESALVSPMRRIVAEGAFTQKVWQVPIEGSTTFRLMDNLRVQLESDGFEVLFECETETCGGFDFRFGTKVAPEPQMHVDLGDFRYLAVQRLGQASPEYLSLIVSRSEDVGYIQMILVGPPEVEVASTSTAESSVALSAGSLAERLDISGAAVLTDLVFPRGSSQLEEGEFASLNQLAKYLRQHKDRKVILVGHTDAEGSLEGNIVLSRKRAQSVVDRLREGHGISKDQLSADGVGYLAPKASNLTPEGRMKNRRVEAVLTSTQ